MGAENSGHSGDQTTILSTGCNAGVAGNGQGAFFSFVRSGGQWINPAGRISPGPGVSAYAKFGHSVDVQGNTAVAGAYIDNTDGDCAGSVYVYTRTSSTANWSFAEKLTSPGGASTAFGTSVAVHGDSLLAGAPWSNTAYLYDLSTTDPATALNASGTANFGHSLAISIDSEGVDTFLVGTPGSGAGSAFVFVPGVPADNTPPVITAPADVSAEATGTSTAVTLGTASVFDENRETLTATPDNSGPFALGETIVTWSATDSAGNTGTDTQRVTITDTTPPLITAPDDVEVTATGVLTDVTLGVAIASDNSGSVTSISPDNAGPFPVGDTTVTWTARDASGNSATDTQLVTVLPQLDLDINTFKKRGGGPIRLARIPTITFVIKVKNNSASTATVDATLVGMRGSTEVYSETHTVSDAPGGGSSNVSGQFSSYTPTDIGDITWVLSFDDDDPDDDTRTITTTIR